MKGLDAGSSGGFGGGIGRDLDGVEGFGFSGKERGGKGLNFAEEERGNWRLFGCSRLLSLRGDKRVVKERDSGLAWGMDLEGFGGREGGLKGEESC